LRQFRTVSAALQPESDSWVMLAITEMAIQLVLLGANRRALHDVIAGTAVIYSWDARAARLRFLSRT
jgi:uncharacterized RDD family membrane protein YckC